MRDSQQTKKSSTHLLLLLTMLAGQLAAPALAFRLPQGGLAIDRLLGPLRQGHVDLSYMPVLLDLSRVLGQFQEATRFPPGISQQPALAVPSFNLSRDDAGGLTLKDTAFAEIALCPLTSGPAIIPVRQAQTTSRDALALPGLFNSELLYFPPQSPPTKELAPFLFWTCHKAAFNQHPRDGSSSSTSFYNGSFLACQDKTALQWLGMRQFSLLHGRLLAVNRGGNLGISTPSGSVLIKPGTAAIVEYDSPGLLTVMSLENSAGTEITVDLANPVGDNKQVKLLPSHALMAGHDSMPEVILQQVAGLRLYRMYKGKEQLLGSFLINDLLKNEILLNLSNPLLTDKQRGALQALRQRMSAQNKELP